MVKCGRNEVSWRERRQQETTTQEETNVMEEMVQAVVVAVEMG